MPYANTDPFTEAAAPANEPEAEPSSPSDGASSPSLARDEPRESILQFFAYEHLPPELQEVSKPFGDVAHFIVDAVPRNAERSTALRKILEAKDAAVRALIAK